MIFVSRSKFFLQGISRIIEGGLDHIKIVTKSSHNGIRSLINGTRPEVLFFDNRSLDLDIIKLRDLIKKESPHTRVILFANKKRYKIDFPNIEYINKRTTSYELLGFIRQRKQIFGKNSRAKARKNEKL